MDGILFDIGMSSIQIDDPLRGFSYGSDGPLGWFVINEMVLFNILKSILL